MTNEEQIHLMLLLNRLGPRAPRPDWEGWKKPIEETIDLLTLLLPEERMLDVSRNFQGLPDRFAERFVEDHYGVKLELTKGQRESYGYTAVVHDIDDEKAKNRLKSLKPFMDAICKAKEEEL